MIRAPFGSWTFFLDHIDEFSEKILMAYAFSLASNSTIIFDFEPELPFTQEGKDYIVEIKYVINMLKNKEAVLDAIMASYKV